MPEPTRFLSAKLKVERACQHIQEAKQWLDAFIKRNPYRARIVRDPQTGHGSAEMLVPQAVTLPSSIPAIVGDAVHNLRAALDHVAAEIMTGSGNKPESIYFPIDETRESLMSQARFKKIERFAPDLARIIIDEIRPYRAANGSFLGLNCLDRADKHRTLIVVPIVGTITVRCVDDDNDAASFPAGTLLVLPEGKLPRPGSLADLHNQRNSTPSMDICFGKGEPFEGQPVIPTLHKLAQLVRGVVETLEAYLQRRELAL